ncbi:MAG TPA: FMN-binding negative transcriptional regulator [Candidatus Elarobacter sp.]|nr:FMN-binding negative transcriptional regulator [Candidatus Elarobacter sp.]
MYIPPSNAEHDPAVIFDFIQSNPLGALVTASGDGLFATHLPFVLDRARGQHGTLEGHIARANPHHRQALTTHDALVIFTGPDAYITPSWYPAKREHGKVVPTWNYVAVHAYGTLRFIEDEAFLRRHLEALVQRHESARNDPWAIADAPAEYIAAQARAIVGLELVITRLEGKWKMSQNRSAADIDGVVRGLGESADPEARAVGELVRAARDRLAT